MKCKYGHCKYDGREIVGDDYVQVNNSYYHSDCYCENENIKRSMALFREQINPNVVYAELRRTINNIVYNKGIDAAFLLFGIKYYVANNIPLNYPAGLNYVVQNKSVKAAWEKKQKSEIQKIKIDLSTGLEVDSISGYKKQKKKGIGDLFE